MSSSPALKYLDESVLIERLTNGLSGRNQEVVFLVGSPLSAPYPNSDPNAHGVPDVEGMIGLIRHVFKDDASQMGALVSQLNRSKERRYQAAFQFLLERRGPQAANDIIRSAVLAARTVPSGEQPQLEADTLRLYEESIDDWALSPGIESLGRLLATYPEHFGRTILTTNFDPLLGIAVRRAGGSFYRTVMHADGDLTQTMGPGCHVVHLHGYWYGADTLHTPSQLTHPRPRLKHSLSNLLRSKLLVVCGYGGWDDVFTDALIDVMQDDNAFPELMWTFHGDRPQIDGSLLNSLEPGIGRGRVIFYSSIDCHKFFPRLHDAWERLVPRKSAVQIRKSNSVNVGVSLRDQVSTSAEPQIVVEGDDEDRPPVVDVCVGRGTELQKLIDTEAHVVFLNGIGGQGKSTVAARYFVESQQAGRFTYFVWRDCKEESERFENQLVAVIEKLSQGRIYPYDLAKQSARTLAEVLEHLIVDVRVLFVFDNVDHYVDLSQDCLIGAPNAFVSTLLNSKGKSRAIFTCRPNVRVSHPLALTCRLEGLSLDATYELFQERQTPAEPQEIADAHSVTEGHAFWLDLLAIQVSKRASVIDLGTLVSQIRSGGGVSPTNTLNSIWDTLREREQVVLRVMAETVKPETEVALGEYLSGQLGYSKVIKALKTLRALNLVVIKQRPGASDVLELHPLVRHFVRQNFAKHERVTFVNRIIVVYQRWMEQYRSQLEGRVPLSTLEYWTQGTELDINAGRFADAFETLAEVAFPLRKTGYIREFVRPARMLLASADWVEDFAKYDGFERVFEVCVKGLAYLGEYLESDMLLEKYNATLSARDVRYVEYCEMRCTTKWLSGDFEEAVRWGKEGKALVEASDVDIHTDIGHALALAERDAGRPEDALVFFLYGRELSQVIDPDELEESRSGAYYGNIGRCLQFMGDVDAAVVCYQKSALLLERSPDAEFVTNQGYIRAWIGDVLLARGQTKLGIIFLRASYLKWQYTSPPKARKLSLRLKQLEQKHDVLSSFDDATVENLCLKWIAGHNLDEQFA